MQNEGLTENGKKKEQKNVEIDLTKKNCINMGKGSLFFLIQTPLRSASSWARELYMIPN